MAKTDFKKLMKQLENGTATRLNKYNKELLLQYKKALDDVRLATLKSFESVGANDLRFLRLQELEKNIESIVKKLTSSTTKLVKDSVADIYMFNYTGLGTALKTSVGFGIVNEKAVESLVLNKFNWDGANLKYGNELLQNIKSEIIQGNIQGKGVQQITKAIADNFNITANNASRIVRTETHRAESMARQLSLDENERIAQENGYKMVKIWSAAGDARESHLEADGTEADENGYFNVGGELIEYPGDGSPENSVNCRCAVIIDLKNVE